MATEADYLAQAQALLPKGPAWTRDKNANLTSLLAAFASNFHAVDRRAASLANEAIPSNSVELLADWERICGLPNECGESINTPKTVEERRNDVIHLLTSNASPTANFFQSLAARMGYEIQVSELKPFISGLSRCGDKLNGAPIIRYHVITVFVKGERVAQFRTGVACCGDLLGSIRYATELECMFEKLKPAHVVFIYSYK